MLDQIVSVVVSDNLDLGCTLIERAATDKAVRDIDKSLQVRAQARAGMLAAAGWLRLLQQPHNHSAQCRHAAGGPPARCTCQACHTTCVQAFASGTRPPINPRLTPTMTPSAPAGCV